MLHFAPQTGRKDTEVQTEVFFFFLTACVSRLFSVQQSQSPQHSSHRKDVGEVFCGQGFKSLPQGTDYVLQLFLC